MERTRTSIPAIGKILLATDGSEDAALAVRAVLDLSRATGAEVHVAHAWTLVGGFGYPAVLWTDYSYLYEREARTLLQEQVDALEGLGAGEVRAHLLNGPPIDAILDLCERMDPDLLVMGSRGRGRLARLLLGSVSEGVIHHAAVPVLVIRGGPEAWPPGRVVAGDDGSENSLRAARMAFGIGGLFDARSTLVRAYQAPPEPIGGWGAGDRQRLDKARSREAAKLEERARTLGYGAGGARPETRLTEADATSALVAAAEERGRTLVAVGSRGLGWAGRIRLGSVSTNVLRAVPGPVLVYPHARLEATERAAGRATAALDDARWRGT